MVKLRKFKEKKLTNKNIMISFVTIIVLLITLVFSKSYAIYKMQKEFDVIKSQIGTFTNGDVKVAVLVDGKETNEFPSYETNYKIESVECTNGVTGSFDVENWQVTIADMKATSTKCTVSFNSSATNEITPVNMSKTELIALNEEITNMAASTILDKVYPVGSIYMSTEDDTVEKVQNKFGGTWVKYAEDMTLVGASSSKAVNTTGGSSTVSLKSENIPSLIVSGTTDKTGNGYTIGYSSTKETTSTDGGHRHGAENGANSNLATFDTQTNRQDTGVGFATSGRSYWAGYGLTNWAGDHSHTVNDWWANKITGVESHSHTFSGNYTNSNPQNINVQNPYISVYMYKRTA